MLKTILKECLKKGIKNEGNEEGREWRELKRDWKTKGGKEKEGRPKM